MVAMEREVDSDDEEGREGRENDDELAHVPLLLRRVHGVLDEAETAEHPPELRFLLAVGTAEVVALLISRAELAPLLVKAIFEHLDDGLLVGDLLRGDREILVHLAEVPIH